MRFVTKVDALRFKCDGTFHFCTVTSRTAKPKEDFCSKNQLDAPKYQINFILEWHSTCFGRSFRPSSAVQDCTYSNRHLSNRYCCLLASKCLLLYVQSLTADDGRKDRPKHVECHSKIKLIWYNGASSWFYYRSNIRMHGPVEVKSVK